MLLTKVVNFLHLFLLIKLNSWILKFLARLLHFLIFAHE